LTFTNININSIYKLKSLNNPISEGDGEELGRVNPSNVQESQVRLESTYSVARDNIPEAPDLIEGHYAQVYQVFFQYFLQPILVVHMVQHKYAPHNLQSQEEAASVFDQLTPLTS
jgi:hypothetical protein